VKRFVAILRLVRLGSCVAPFLAIFIPVLLRTNNLVLSFGRATPLLFICMCTFIANSLDDVEKDRVNHPERPLPAHQLTPTFATILYFGSLLASLFLIRHYVPERFALWYYGLTVISTSYHYVVDFLPGLKAFYVAATVSFLPLMMAAWFPKEAKLYFVAGSAFLFTAGKEICMDIRDRRGDPISFMHRVKPLPLAIVAFSLEALGLFLLATQVRRSEDIIDVLAITSLLAISMFHWFKLANYKRAILLMRLQFIFAIYFLC
jgi:UbiA prenyltransferase family protein